MQKFFAICFMVLMCASSVSFAGKATASRPTSSPTSNTAKGEASGLVHQADLVYVIPKTYTRYADDAQILVCSSNNRERGCSAYYHNEKTSIEEVPLDKFFKSRFPRAQQLKIVGMDLRMQDGLLSYVFWLKR